MRFSTGRNTRSPGAAPPPNTLAMYPPRIGIETPSATIRRSSWSQSEVCITALPRASELLRDEERGDEVHEEDHGEDETDDVLDAHDATSAATSAVTSTPGSGGGLSSPLRTMRSQPSTS